MSNVIIIDERLGPMTDLEVQVYVSNLIEDGILEPCDNWLVSIAGKWSWLDFPDRDSFIVRVEDFDPRVHIYHSDPDNRP